MYQYIQPNICSCHAVSQEQGTLKTKSVLQDASQHVCVSTLSAMFGQSTTLVGHKYRRRSLQCFQGISSCCPLAADAVDSTVMMHCGRRHCIILLTTSCIAAGIPSQIYQIPGNCAVDFHPEWSQVHVKPLHFIDHRPLCAFLLAFSGSAMTLA